jgi:MoaA/NifB/PqqE/SkfB family radical SAM enzyme
MKQFPQIVTLRITSRCNNNCKYCFAPKNAKEMNLSKLKKLFRLFYNSGVKAVLLTGGEPLLRDDFDEILKELNRYHLKIFLDTNGDFFFKYKNLISKYVDVIGLPIDFPDSSYRNKRNLKIILEILSYYKKLKKHPAIRIGTVVTKDNFKRLNEVGELLKNYPVDIWKIYQFTPQNLNAIKNKSYLEISQKEFDGVTKNIENVFSNWFTVVVSKRKDRNCAYFFIDSDGTVFMPVDDLDICREEKIGTIFEKDILDKWKRWISEKEYVNNAKATFNYKF